MPDPLALQEMADRWRERGDIACADELQAALNQTENRAGVWLPIHDGIAHDHHHEHDRKLPGEHN